MKPFTFRLQALLDLREMKRREALEAYAHATQARQEAQDMVTDAEATLRRLQDALRESRERGMSPAQVAHAFAYLEGQRHELEKLRQRLEQTTDRQHETLEAYKESKREKELIERLRDKRREKYLAEQRRKEEADLDDITMMRAGGTVCAQPGGTH